MAIYTREEARAWIPAKLSETARRLVLMALVREVGIKGGPSNGRADALCDRLDDVKVPLSDITQDVLSYIQEYTDPFLLWVNQGGEIILLNQNTREGQVDEGC